MSGNGSNSSSRCTGKRKYEGQHEASNKIVKSSGNVEKHVPTVCSCRQLACPSCGGPSYLPVREPKFYLRGKPNFSVRYEIGNFSVDGQRAFVNDQSQLKYIHITEAMLHMPLDLNLGYENVIRKAQEINEKLDILLKWVLAYNTCKTNEIGTCNTSSIVLKCLRDIDFVCYRGLLKTILTTPYERREDWIICATKFKGIIYLVAFPTERKRQQIANMTEREKKMSSWGYKFEQYLTKGDPKGRPESPHVPVNENEEYCIVLKSQLNNHVVIYGAELDGISDTATSESRHTVPTNYIELKTSRVITRENQNITFLKHKALNWWAQSYLASVTKLYCGFRDDSGVVQCIRSYSLPQLAELGKHFWSPAVCLNFADCFLSFVKKAAIKDDPSVIYKFDWVPGSAVTCQELHSSTSPEFQILPEWYISNFDT